MSTTATAYAPGLTVTPFTRHRVRRLLPINGTVRVAVDGAFAHWHDGLRDGSEVAFIPPVSGG